jgi:hypothetical protein
MNFLKDVITYVRRIIKSPSNTDISDNLIIDYINRFWIMDVDARMQLFDLKTKYQFQTEPGVDQYNMPLYNVQSETPNSSSAQDIGMYPVYQGFLGPAYINGVQVSFQTERNLFFRNFPNVVQQSNVVGMGNGTAGPYTLRFTISPNNSLPINPPIQYLLRGHVDITGIIATGSNVDPFFGSTLSNDNAIPPETPVMNIPSTSIYPAVYFTSIDANGNSIVVQDSGQFLQSPGPINNANLGLLMEPGNAPYGYSALSNGYVSTFEITGVTQASPAVLTATTNFVVGQIIQIANVGGMTELNGNSYTVVAVDATTVTINVDSSGFTAYTTGGSATGFQNVINYLTGEAIVTFPAAIPSGAQINGQCFFFQSGLPRAVLFNNNIITLRSPPDRQYLVELEAYLSPAAFFNTSAAIPFGYMAEYIARGAARKILSDTGDVEQFMFYEPLFIEQENLVWKRSQRQFTATRTHTIYSQGGGQGNLGFNNFSGVNSL